jgi:Bacterial Ig domain
MWKSIIHQAAALLAALLLAACSTGPQGPRTWLDRPLEGSHVPIKTLVVQAHASDADGVSRIEFFVGDTPLATVSSNGSRLVDAQVQWTPPGPGTYTIRARAADGKGNIGDRATSLVVVGGVTNVVPAPLLTPPGEVRPLLPLPTQPAPPQPPTPAGPPPGPQPQPLMPTGQPPPSQPPPLGCAGPPVIPFFTASPATITAGQSSLLSWGNVTNGTTGPWVQSTVINPDLGEVGSGASSRQVTPPQTTTYTLTATGCGGTATKQLTIIVNPSATTQPPSGGQAGCAGPPMIPFFNANPTSITAGQSSMLSWGNVTNGTSGPLVRSAVINPGLGEVGSGASSRPVKPAQTTTYTLTATGCGGTATKQVTVTVNPPGSPPPAKDTTPPNISNAKADPTRILKQGGGCPSYSRTTTVTATVSDAGIVDRVAARWNLGALSGEVVMSAANGNAYRAVLGPFNTTGNLSIRVIATDRAGNSNQSAPLTVLVQNCID